MPAPRQLPEDTPPPPPVGRPTMPTREPPKPPPLRSAPDGDAAVPMACPSAAAGPAYNEAARFPKQTPPVPDAAAPPFLMTAAGPAYLYPPPPTRGQTKEPPPQMKEEYQLKATPDADRGQPPDAATQKKNVHAQGEHENTEPLLNRQWVPPPPLSRPAITQFIEGCFYQHTRFGEVRFLSMQTDEHGRDQCCVRQWNDERGAMTEFWVPSAEMRVWEHPTGVGRATGVAANPTDITEPRRMYYVNTPTNDDQPYVREDDAGLIAGRMLQATANYNIADDPESCVGGLPYKVFPGLDVAVLEVRKGDLIRFIKMTSHTDVGYGELISSALLQAGKEQAPTMGCFSTLRCVYAKSTDARPVPKVVCSAAQVVRLKRLRSQVARPMCLRSQSSSPQSEKRNLKRKSHRI